MRIKFIADALEINAVQAEILSELIQDIPDNKLKDFFVFRMRYIEPMMSKELITKKALFDYRRMKYEAGIKSGTFKFETKEQLQNYIQTYYRGKELGNGLGSYCDYVIIGVDESGEFVNKYALDDFTGKYKKLNSEDTALVLDDLLENQAKIGDVKHITQHETKAAERIGQRCVVSSRALNMTKNIAREMQE